jgi:hypothetical protein
MAAMTWVVRNAFRADRFDGRGGLSPFLKVSTDFPVGGRYPGDPYIGSKSCAGCHPGEYALFTGSGHARTFRPASERRITDLLTGSSVVDPVRKDVRWSYEKAGGQFLVRREERDKIERFVIDYALGSGHHATTFVSVLDLEPPKILEHRLTYYTRDRHFGITPGQSPRQDDPGSTRWGHEFGPVESRKCFRCHATQISARDDSMMNPREMIPGVNCERCHGPGRAHVESAGRGESGSVLPLLLGDADHTAEAQIAFCGNCHRHPSKVAPDQLDPDDPILARFQPIGLTQSRCFKGGKGELSCISCHDPHARSSEDPASYEPVCLGCHRPPPAHRPESVGPESSHLVSAPTCPVSTSSGCVKCHMPKVDSGQHVLFTDHWIRVVKPRKQSARASHP